MQPLKVSVIIPVYNSEAFLQKCIESVTNQSYTDLQIILVNDGSTDNSGTIINKYADLDKRIKAIHKENGGIGSAYKIAFEHATGEYILFVDSDDWLQTGAIEKLVQLSMEKVADMVSFGLQAYNVEGEKVILSSFNNINLYNSTNEEILKTHFEILKHPTLVRLYKRSLFEDIVVFEQNIGIDEMLTPQLLLKCNKAVYTTEVFYNVLIRQDSVCRAVYTEKKILDTIKVYDFLCDYLDKNRPEFIKYIRIKYLNILIAFIRYSRENSKVLNQQLLTSLKDKRNRHLQLLWREPEYLKEPFAIRLKHRIHYMLNI